MRNAVNTLVERHNGICGIFSGKDETGYRYILGSKNMDARTAATALREKLGAKGGGRAAMVQGSVNTTKSAIQEVIDAL